jgi:hypothetical protein
MLTAGANRVEGEMLTCKLLCTHTKGENIFNLPYMWLKKGLTGNSMLPVTPVALDRCQIQAILLHTLKRVNIEQCLPLYHCRALGMKTIPDALKTVLDTDTAMESFVNSALTTPCSFDHLVRPVWFQRLA